MTFYSFICEIQNWEQDVGCTQPAVLVQDISSIGERGRPCHVHVDYEQNFLSFFVSVAQRCLKSPVSNSATPSWHIWWHEKGRAESWGRISKVTQRCMFLFCTGRISSKYCLNVAMVFHYFSSAPIWFLFPWFCFHTITSHLFPFFFISSHVVAIIACQNLFLFFLFKNINFRCPGQFLKVQVLEVFNLPLSIRFLIFFPGDGSGICNNQQHNSCWGNKYKKIFAIFF